MQLVDDGHVQQRAPTKEGTVKRNVALGVVLALLLVAAVAMTAAAATGKDRFGWIVADKVSVINDTTFLGEVNAQDAVDLDSTLNVDGASTLVGAVGVTGAATFGGVINQAIDIENVGGLPTILSADIITTTNGAIFTIADGEIWFVNVVYCDVTTNFDCTGDDCTLQIGDGGDANGLLDMVDAELQAASVGVTGGAAGWHGYEAGTIGAYMTSGAGFIYAPSGAAETIDIAIEDTSAATDPTAGAATCYIVYTRIQ